MSADYPKVIDVHGLPVTVTDESDEARWRAAPTTPPEPEPASEPIIPDVVDDPEIVAPANPLDDLELDGAATNDGHVPEPEPDAPTPKKKKALKKK